MVLSCVAYGCSNHNRMINKPGFYRFPNNNPELRKRWINACKRVNKDGSPWNPTSKNVYICGDHFIGGNFLVFSSIYILQFVGFEYLGCSIAIYIYLIFFIHFY